MSTPTHIYIATTQGLISVNALTDLDDPELFSLVCQNGTSNQLAISGDYHKFVKRGSGIIQKDFGGSSYRLDISAPIDQGNSWQLAIYLAHALLSQQQLGDGVPRPGEHVIIATGAVNVLNKNIESVGHIARKLSLAETQVIDWRRNNIEVDILLPSADFSQAGENRLGAHAVTNIEFALSYFKALNSRIISEEVTRVYRVIEQPAKAHKLDSLAEQVNDSNMRDDAQALVDKIDQDLLKQTQAHSRAGKDLNTHLQSQHVQGSNQHFHQASQNTLAKAVEPQNDHGLALSKKKSHLNAVLLLALLLLTAIGVYVFFINKNKPLNLPAQSSEIASNSAELGIDSLTKKTLPLNDNNKEQIKILSYGFGHVSECNSTVLKHLPLSYVPKPQDATQICLLKLQTNKHVKQLWLIKPSRNNSLYALKPHVAEQYIYWQAPVLKELIKGQNFYIVTSEAKLTQTQNNEIEEKLSHTQDINLSQLKSLFLAYSDSINIVKTEVYQF